MYAQYTLAVRADPEENYKMLSLWRNLSPRRGRLANVLAPHFLPMRPANQRPTEEASHPTYKVDHSARGP